MKLNVAVKTDTGLLYEHNEDYFVARRQTGLFLVADGVGGADAGELASKVACQLIEQALQPSATAADPSRHDAALTKAIRDANHGLFDYATHSVDKREVGTTITALWFHGDRVLFAYVGDSRIYLYRDGVLRQLSRDEKAGRYRLAASLGQGPTVEPHLGMVRLRRGDRFLLCSDGLYGPVAQADLVTMLDSERDPEACCARLIDAANDAGGPDNITALVADVVEPDPPGAWRFSRVWLDATSPLSRLLRAPVWLGIAAAALIAAALIWWAAASSQGTGDGQPPPIAGRLAILAGEANHKAERGDRPGTLQALHDLVREAVRQRKRFDRADLALDDTPAVLLDQATADVWRELLAPATKEMADLAGTPAERYVEAELRTTRDRIDHIHKQFLADDYRFVAETFDSLHKEVATICQRARRALARDKQRLQAALDELKLDATEFEHDSPVRLTLDAHIAAAAKALEADDVPTADKQIQAAKAAVKHALRDDNE